MEKSDKVSRKCGYRLGSLDMIFFTSPLLTGRGGEGGIDSREVCVAAGGCSAALKLPHHFMCSTS